MIIRGTPSPAANAPPPPPQEEGVHTQATVNAPAVSDKLKAEGPAVQSEGKASVATGIAATFAADSVSGTELVALLSQSSSAAQTTAQAPTSAAEQLAAFANIKLGAPPKDVKAAEAFSTVAQTLVADAPQNLSPAVLKSIVLATPEGIASPLASLLPAVANFPTKLEALKATVLSQGEATAPALPATVLQKFAEQFPAIRDAMRACGYGDDVDFKKLASKLKTGFAGALQKALLMGNRSEAKALAQEMRDAFAAFADKVPSPSIDKALKDLNDWLAGDAAPGNTLSNAARAYASLIEQPSVSTAEQADALGVLASRMQGIGLAAMNQWPAAQGLLQAHCSDALRKEYATLFLPQLPPVSVPPAELAKLERALLPAAQKLLAAGASESAARAQSESSAVAKSDSLATPASELAASAGGVWSSALGIDFETADVSTLITWVMAQCRQTDHDILSDQMKDMKAANDAKRAQRERIGHMREEQASLENDQHKMFDTLLASGVLKSDISFDDFKKWCPVMWDANGNMSLANPFPEIPEHMRSPAPTEPQEPAIALPPGIDPLPQATAEALAQKYGVSVAEIQMAYAVFQHQSQEGRYVGGTLVKSDKPVTSASFESDFLARGPRSAFQLGLKPSQGDPKVAAENTQAINAFKNDFASGLAKQAELETKALTDSAVNAAGLGPDARQSLEALAQAQGISFEQLCSKMGLDMSDELSPAAAADNREKALRYVRSNINAKGVSTQARDAMMKADTQLSKAITVYGGDPTQIKGDESLQDKPGLSASEMQALNTALLNPKALSDAQLQALLTALLTDPSMQQQLSSVLGIPKPVTAAALTQWLFNGAVANAECAVLQSYGDDPGGWGAQRDKFTSQMNQIFDMAGDKMPPAMKILLDEVFNRTALALVPSFAAVSQAFNAGGLDGGRQVENSFNAWVADQNRDFDKSVSKAQELWSDVNNGRLGATLNSIIDGTALGADLLTLDFGDVLSDLKNLGNDLLGMVGLGGDDGDEQAHAYNFAGSQLGSWASDGLSWGADPTTSKIHDKLQAEVDAYQEQPAQPYNQSGQKTDIEGGPVTAGALAIADAWQSASDLLGAYNAEHASWQNDMDLRQQNYDASMGVMQEMAANSAGDLSGQLTEGSGDMFAAAIETEQGKLDSMSDTTDTMQTRLQLTMDRYQKVNEMLSNLMKKIGDTQSTIAGNMK